MATYGIIALRANAPEPDAEEGHDWPYETMAYPLNASLVQWAYSMTRETQLPDTDAMRKARADFVPGCRTQLKPLVCLSSATPSAPAASGTGA